MAASDPSPYVATPTGVLQGVAAFSWDGSAWQPSGRAGPDVATPTGVLQGVAPFSWSGSAWTPVGRAQPGVATPTGVLDGVAVYTWSGSAWVPPGGTETPSTPSGALRGIAAFSWDGAAWQPAGQARPSVPTPYGVLDGVAFFNWSGTTWAAGSATVPSGATLDLSFLSGTLDARLTFTRASTGTYFDATGTLQTATTNGPRFDYDPVTHALRGLLIEDQRTNVLLNSAALGTQSVAVTAQAYTLSFYGTGTVTMSGAFAGSLVGTGAFPARAQTTFTPAAGTLTCTITGSVLNAQLEAGGFLTSYIPTTGAAATRAIDVCGVAPANMGWFTPPGGSWQAEFIPFNANNTRVLGLPAAGGITQMYAAPGQTLAQFDGVGAAGTANFVSLNAVNRGASNLGGGLGRVCLNGGAVGSGAMTTGYGTETGAGVGFLTTGPAGNADNTSGYIRRVRYWPRVLSDAEMQSVTT